MTLAERDQLILTIIFSLVGFVFLLLIISFLFCRVIQFYRLKHQRHLHSIPHRRSPPIPIYQRSQKPTSKHRTKKRQKRSNTNDSAITLSFNPPHLINQNVKQLEKFYQNESTLTANSWFFDETFGKKNRHYNHSSSEPIYASSSTVLTSISNLAVAPSHIPEKSHPCVNEVDQVLHVKHPLKYSQSYRQNNEPIFCDYYRSVSPPSTVISTNNSVEPIYIRTHQPSTATLIRLSRLVHLRDDTAILY